MSFPQKNINLTTPVTIEYAEKKQIISKEELVDGSIQGLISLAIPLPLLGGLFTNLAGENLDSNDFPRNDYDHAFAYIHPSQIKSYRDMIITEGKIPLHAVEHFCKYPHPTKPESYKENDFHIVFNNKYAERDWRNTQQDKLASVYLTAEAVLNSPLFNPPQDLQPKSESTELDKNKKEWELTEHKYKEHSVTQVVPFKDLQPISESTELDKNKKEWELSEHEYKEQSAVQLVPLVMKSLGIDPLAYILDKNLKSTIYERGQKLFYEKFRMSLNSFSRGGRSTWNKAKKEGLIKEK